MNTLAEVMSNDVNRSETSALDVRLIQWEALPFRSDPRILAIWGPRDANGLKRLIEEDGRIKHSLSCARIKVDDGPPILYDGYTRLLVHFARKAEGKHETVPAYEVEEFETFAEVLDKVLKVQTARRNVTAMQAADTALQIKQMQGFDIAPQPNGRPKGETRNASLKRLPSAKALAKEFDVSDRIIRIMQQAKAMLSPEDQQRMLFSTKAKEYLSPEQASKKIETIRRDAKKDARKRTIQRRQKQAAAMLPHADSAAIAPDGLFTVDAIKGIKDISAGTIDLVCTSIPYACDVTYDNSIPYDGDYEKYLDTYVRGWLAAVKPALKSGGRIAINFDSTYRSLDKRRAGRDADRVPHLFNAWKDISRIAEDELGYLFMGYRIWYKQACSRQFATGSRDSAMPIGNPNTEFILIFAKDSMRLEGASDITAKEYDRFALSHWYVLPQRQKPLDSDDFHPAPFPEEIPYRLIRMLCPKHGTVLDPFNGSGTTTFVAKALGRRYIGLDNSSLSTESAKRRLAELDGLTAMERTKRIERFVSDTEHGMPPHKRTRGVDPNQEDGPSSAGLIDAA